VAADGEIENGAVDENGPTVTAKEPLFVSVKVFVALVLVRTAPNAIALTEVVTPPFPICT